MSGQRGLSIRKIAAQDVDRARELIRQLGYDLDPDEFSRRLSAVASADQHALLVAELEHEVVGLMHLYARPALDKPVEAIVQALVVDSRHRSKRIGQALMQAAESWAQDRHLSSVALTSQIKRTDAHRFYQSLGYEIAATSHLLRKSINLDQFNLD
jgi:GNAT superfamily N-acetyltransferase